MNNSQSAAEILEKEILEFNEESIKPYRSYMEVVESCRLFSMDEHMTEIFNEYIFKFLNNRFRNMICEYVHSRLHQNGVMSFPWGVLKRSPVVFAGINPSNTESINNTAFLRPTLSFTKYSKFMRDVLRDPRIKDALKIPPYFTNIIKYATIDNKVSPYDYDLSIKSFKFELEVLDPKIIFAIGKEVYARIPERYNVIYLVHPSYYLRRTEAAIGKEKTIEDILENIK